MVSIPLAILTSVALLSATGETINVMTLGGLALAVGILVDDATVTIENINYHLEQGKDIETAIMDGARQIVIPATVSLSCICIVFVPMFTLGGVAGYLFRPMAKAVVFRAHRLLCALAHAGQHDGALPARPSGDDAQPRGRRHEPRNPLVLFQRGFERRFEAVRAFYRRLLMTALSGRFVFIGGFLAASLASFALAPYLGRNFFPPVESTQIALHVRAPTGTRIEETGVEVDRIERAIREIIPRRFARSIVDNIGLPEQRPTNLSYSNSARDRTAGADIFISLKEGHRPSANYIRVLREKLPEAMPGMTFAFLPADIVGQILNFGLPAPIDVQVVGNNLDANRVYAAKLYNRIRAVPGITDAHIQQAFDDPEIRVDVDRSRAQQLGFTELTSRRIC